MALVQNNYDDILGQSLFAQGDAFKQADLNSLYNQQQLEQAKNSTLEGQFKNQQSQVMNPLLVEEQKQQNLNLGYTGQGQQYDNVIRGNVAEASTANQPHVLSKQQRAAAISASEDEMKQLEQYIAKMYTSNDPNVQRDAALLEQKMPAMRAAQREQAATMEKQRLINEGRLAETQMQTGSAQKIRQMEIDAGRFQGKSGAGVPVLTSLVSGKMKVPERLGTVYAILQSEVNPDTQQPLSAMERTYLQGLYDQDAATTEGKNALAAQGIAAKVGPEGGVSIVNKTAPSIRPSGAQATKPTNPKDAAALEWATANPDDPRAALIKQKLGKQ